MARGGDLVTLRRHHPTPSGAVDYRQIPICTCGSVWDAAVHKVAEQSEEQTEYEQRRIGEGER